MSPLADRTDSLILTVKHNSHGGPFSARPMFIQFYHERSPVSPEGHLYTPITKRRKSYDFLSYECYNSDYNALSTSGFRSYQSSILIGSWWVIYGWTIFQSLHFFRPNANTWYWNEMIPNEAVSQQGWFSIETITSETRVRPLKVAGGNLCNWSAVQNIKPWIFLFSPKNR